MAEEAAAAPEEQAEGAPSKKKAIIKIVLMVVAVLFIIGASVGGTLLATGFFSKKEQAKEAVDAQLEKLDGEHGGGDGHGDAKGGDGHGDAKADDGHGAPAKPGAEAPAKELVSPDADNQRWKFNYYSLEKPMLSNLSGSRKVMQVTLTIMTHYDDRVIKNVKTHELALRAGILDLMRTKTEADLKDPDFRKQLAEEIRVVINSLLEKYEGFGGIEEVMFSEFVVQ
ncbi:flagellar basal body-associated protein FliL [Oxalobacteraceae bacterium]|jgi:flagellar FliL protein|nr:flagellar basal body-associated FliL family protein [Oxalobacteraceae bacterium]